MQAGGGRVGELARRFPPVPIDVFPRSPSLATFTGAFGVGGTHEIPMPRPSHDLPPCLARELVALCHEGEIRPLVDLLPPLALLLRLLSPLSSSLLVCWSTPSGHTIGRVIPDDKPDERGRVRGERRLELVSVRGRGRSSRAEVDIVG